MEGACVDNIKTDDPPCCSNGLDFTEANHQITELLEVTLTAALKSKHAVPSFPYSWKLTQLVWETGFLQVLFTTLRLSES